MNAPLPDSPYLSRLVAAIDGARDPAEAACLRVERAGFLARQGFFDLAATEIDAVRAQFAARPNAGVTTWLCIAEAWIAHFRTLDKDAAHDKMKRALALSSAMKLPRLQALSAAWLAHFDFVRDDMESMAKNLSLALKTADPDHHAAQARIGMVAAIAFDYAGRSDLAKPWYGITRNHALRENDQATMSALNYNMAANHAIRSFQSSIFEADSLRISDLAKVSIEASKSFDDWVGSSAQYAFVHMLRALIASSTKRYQSALEIYLEYRILAEEQGQAHMRATYLADIAWCRFGIGDVVGASDAAKVAAEAIDVGMFDEDLAEAHGRLWQVFRQLGEDEAATYHFQLAMQANARNSSNQKSLLVLLESVINEYLVSRP